MLASEIASAFPDSADAFAELGPRMIELSADPEAHKEKALEFLRSHFRDRALADLLALPVFTYAG